jgi:hypothetical protein
LGSAQTKAKEMTRRRPSGEGPWTSFCIARAGPTQKKIEWRRENPAAWTGTPDREENYHEAKAPEENLAGEENRQGPMTWAERKRNRQWHAGFMGAEDRCQQQWNLEADTTLKKEIKLEAVSLRSKMKSKSKEGNSTRRI